MSENLQQTPEQNNNMYSQSLNSLNVGQQNIVNQQTVYNPQDVYMPSSSEKKKCVLMYILFGVLIMMGKKELTEFEYFHMKQSMGRWVIFIMVIILSIVFIFIPFIRILGILPLMFMVGIWFYFIYQVRNGKYSLSKFVSSGFFAGFGGRILGLFQLDIKIIGRQYQDGNNASLVS